VTETDDRWKYRAAWSRFSLNGSSGKSPYSRDDDGDAWRSSRLMATPPSPEEGMAVSAWRTC
jgi:hypothetical protein